MLLAGIGLAIRYYRISTNLSHLARKRDRYDGVAEAAGPILDRLCQKVSWPSDLMVPAGDHLEIRESSRVRTPFAIYFMQDRIGIPVNWVLSAVGRAYLAFCPENERPIPRATGKRVCSAWNLAQGGFFKFAYSERQLFLEANAPPPHQAAFAPEDALAAGL